MKFKINHQDKVEERVLIYRSEEYSFDMKPWASIMDFELALNNLTLTVVDHKIIQLSGFCGLELAMNANINVPNSIKGALAIEDNLAKGFTHKIFKNHQPVYLNSKSGWVCIGNPLKSGKAVEFIQNCIAVIGKEGLFLSLWLHPEVLPILE